MKKNILILGWYQLVGGILGFSTALYPISQLKETTPLIIFGGLSMLLFFAYSMLCGIFCIKQKSNALTLSLINQILQFVSFAVGGFAFFYISGVHFSLGLDLSNSTNMVINFGLSKFNLGINSEPERIEININLIALLLIYWIDKLKRKSKA